MKNNLLRKVTAIILSVATMSLSFGTIQTSAEERNPIIEKNAIQYCIKMGSYQMGDYIGSYADPYDLMIKFNGYGATSVEIQADSRNYKYAIAYNEDGLVSMINAYECNGYPNDEQFYFTYDANKNLSIVNHMVIGSLWSGLTYNYDSAEATLPTTIVETSEMSAFPLINHTIAYDGDTFVRTSYVGKSTNTSTGHISDTFILKPVDGESIITHDSTSMPDGRVTSVTFTDTALSDYCGTFTISFMY